MYRTCTSRISALSTSVPSALLSSSRVMPGRSRTNSSTLCATVGIGVLYTATQWRRTGRRRWLIDQGNVMFGKSARRGSGHHPRWLRRSDGTHTHRSAATAARNLIRWHIPDYNPKHRHPGNQGHSLVQYTRTGGRHGGEWQLTYAVPIRTSRATRPQPFRQPSRRTAHSPDRSPLELYSAEFRAAIWRGGSTGRRASTRSWAGAFRREAPSCPSAARPDRRRPYRPIGPVRCTWSALSRAASASASSLRSNEVGHR